MTAKILITGGAGYIGSHVIKKLGAQTEDIITVDDLSTGNREYILHGNFVQGNIGDTKLMEQVFKDNQIETVIHFAGSISVAESIANPMMYYENNTVNSKRLLDLCTKHKVKNFIFSSTAAVYGIPENGNAKESSPLEPITPYGHSKLMTEMMLKDAARVSSMKYVALRYFNVAGADKSGRIGANPPLSIHLIKIACEVATGRRQSMFVNGNDYPTPDGTCVRDYVHVEDLADAHVKAYEYLQNSGDSVILNCGYEQPFSVKEIIENVAKFTDSKVNHTVAKRRPGDPPILVAEAKKIRQVLGWQPLYGIKEIVLSAYQWEQKLAETETESEATT